MDDQANFSNAKTAKPPCLRGDAVAVVRRLRNGGFVAYFAGGCVRDSLLGLEPQDYDVATDARPDDVRRLFAQTQAVGAAFGVVLVRIGFSVVEVATFRTDGPYRDGRRPDSVTFTDAEHDARRRDFTINGLFQDPLTRQIIDHVGGREDLEARLLRAIGDASQRFGEDHLRLLRAVRFAARFGLTIEPATAEAIGRHAAELRHISPERVAEELRAMLMPASRRSAWPLLERFGLADVILRFASGPEGPAAEGAAAFGRLMPLMDRLPDAAIPFGVALAGAVLARQPMEAAADAIVLATRHAAVVATARALDKALRFSNDDDQQLRTVLESVGKLIDHPADQLPRIAILKRFLALPDAGHARALLRAIAAVGPHARVVAAVEKRLEELVAGNVAPPPFIDGNDLIAMGLTPGKLFKRLLDEVYDAQLEERVSSKGEAIEMARIIARRLSGDLSGG
jgi:poly(A) polymerase